MELSKGKKIALMFALIMATFVPMADLFIIPAAGNMYEYFAGESLSVLNFILSGPALIALFVALIAGKLMGTVRKKLLLEIAIVLFGVGGILGIAVENVYYMAAMRCLVGAACGIVAPCCMAVLNDIFTDEKQLGTMIGIWNAGMSAVGAVVGVVAGVVAAMRWQMVFQLFWVAVPMLLIVIFCMPKETPYEAVRREGMSDPSHVDAVVKEKMPWGALVLDMIGYFAGMLIVCIMYYQIALYLVELNIGTAVLAGTLSTALTIATFVACMSFGVLFAKPIMRKFFPFLMFIVLAVAYFVFAFIPTVAGASVGMVLIGLINGFMMSYYQSHVAIIVPESQAPFALSITSSVLGLGMFLTTYVFTLLRGVGSGTVTFVCLVLAVASVIMAVPALLRHRKDPTA